MSRGPEMSDMEGRGEAGISQAGYLPPSQPSTPSCPIALTFWAATCYAPPFRLHEGQATCFLPPTYLFSVLEKILPNDTHGGSSASFFLG